MAAGTTKVRRPSSSSGIFVPVVSTTLQLLIFCGVGCTPTADAAWWVPQPTQHYIHRHILRPPTTTSITSTTTKHHYFTVAHSSKNYDIINSDDNDSKSILLVVPKTCPTSSSGETPIRLSLGTAVRDLRHLRQNYDKNNTSANELLVEVEGYITAKRSFGSSFGFLDVTDALVSTSPPVQVMVKRQEFDSNNNTNSATTSFVGTMKAILVPGARVRIVGRIGHHDQQQELLVVAHRVQLVEIPRNPQHIELLLRAVVVDRTVSLDDVAQATHWSVEALKEALSPAFENHNMQGGGENETNRRRDDHRSTYSLLKNLARKLWKSLPPEKDCYPREILQQKHDHGRYTLPSPDAELQLPPPAATARLDLDSGHQGLSSSLALFSVQHVTNNWVAPMESKYNTSDNTIILVHGWIQNRRRFRGNITLLDLVDEMERPDMGATTVDNANDNQDWALDQVPHPNGIHTGKRPGNNPRLKCVLHPECFVSTSTHRLTAAEAGHVLAPGSQVQLLGYYYCSFECNDAGGVANQQSQSLLWITQIKLLRASWRPSVVRYLMELVFTQKFNVQEAGNAMGQSDAAMKEILQMQDATERQWRAAEISSSLQNSMSRAAVVSPSMASALRSFESLRLKYPVENVLVYQDSAKEDMVHSSSREGSRWARQKEPQLIWMAQQVKQVVANHPLYGKGRPLRILDVGGGKGYLANHLAKLLGSEVTIQVIDMAPGAIKNGVMRSQRLQLPVQYTIGDASQACFHGDIDIVVALHACGALTDVAMGHAAANNAAFVICPCCFKSNPWLKVSSYATAGQRIRQSVEEWLDVDPLQYDLLKYVAEVQGDISLATEAIHSICALRASAIKTHSNNRLTVSIKSFPVAFSSRNFCLVGELHS